MVFIKRKKKINNVNFNSYFCSMLTQEQINIIIETMKPYNPTKIGIFGSVARNEDKENSDIDILYSFNSIYTLFDLAGIQIELEEKLNKEVDLVEYSTINHRLKETILLDSKLIYGL